MLGARRQQEMLANLGLFERSPIELAGSAAPILPQQFDEIHAATVSYGHGIAVSPIAFASAFSIFASVLLVVLRCPRTATDLRRLWLGSAESSSSMSTSRC